MIGAQGLGPVPGMAEPQSLVNIDKEAGTVVPRPPIAMMVFMLDEDMVTSVVVPVTGFVV